MTVKLTFFLLYLQIFRHNTTLKVGIYAGAIIDVTSYIGAEIAQLILATPRHGTAWKEYFLIPRVKKTGVVGIISAAFGLGLDFYILILPIKGVIELQMPTRRKISVCLIFMTGILFAILSKHEMSSVQLIMSIALALRLC